MPYNSKNTADYELCLANLGYKFRKNLMNDRVEILRPNAAEYEPRSEGLESEIRNLAVDNQLAKLTMLDTVNVVAEKNKYHPIKDYFNSLVWDGNQNIEHLASYFTNPDGMFELYLRKWMIGAIAKVFENGKRNAVLVLDGPQMIGKSTFVQHLCWDKKYIKEGAIRPDSNDHELALINIFIWEISELENTTSRAAVGALKDFLSRVRVTARAPYGHYALADKPSVTSFIGTINNMAGFLNDDSGSSRFRTTHISKIDFGYNKIDINQCWAQAMQLYMHGHTADLHPDDQAKMNRINESYEVPNPIVDAINQFFNIDTNDTTNYLTSFQIRSVLIDKDYGNLHGFEFSNQKMASALKKVGCEKKQKKFSNNTVLNVYYGIRPKSGILLPNCP
jgi:predicted P-loop ATPase